MLSAVTSDMSTNKIPGKKMTCLPKKKKHTCASASHSESSLCSTFSVKPISEISGTSFKFRPKNTTANAILEIF